jgi:aspartate kinase
MSILPFSSSESVRPTKVLKFGGSSVGSAETLRRVVSIISETAGEHRAIVIVSALSGVTNRLVEALDELQAGLAEHERLVHDLLARHRRLAAEVLSPWAQDSYALAPQHQLDALSEALQQAQPCGVTPALRDAVLAVGERLSAPLVALALQDVGLQAAAQDATALIRTDDAHGAAGVDYPCTEQQVRAWHAGLAPDVVPVVTGFIGPPPR